MKEVTIVINTCDKYFEAWKVLAYSFKKYWSDCPWDILFMTNYLDAPMGKSTKLGDVSNWTTMMKETMKVVRTPYILLTLDDFWLTDKIDTKSLREFVEVMKRDSITHIRLIPATDGKFDYPKDDRFKVISGNSLYRTSLTTAIWKKEAFVSFLEGNETPWQFETNGRLRERGRHLILATKVPYFHCLQQDNPDVKWKGQCAIQQGKWFPGAKKYAEEEGIEIDFSVEPKDIKIEKSIETKQQEIKPDFNKLIKRFQKIIIPKIEFKVLVKKKEIKVISEPIKMLKYIEEQNIENLITPILEEPKKPTVKILWLYQYMKQYNYDHWFHMDFVEAIAKHEGIELKCYGLGLDKFYPDISIEYNKNKLLSHIKQEFDFDIVISNTKSRMFRSYVPPILGEEKRFECWLPEDFGTWNKTPKISLEEDYHYEVDDSWYTENNVDLMLQRHYSQSIRKETIKKIWYPFSVDTKIFKSDNIERIPKLCNAGNRKDHVYPYRHRLVEILEPMGWLKDYHTRLIDNDYLECLKKYVSHICCPSIYDITPAKIFEITASGSLLFTSNSDKYGLKYLFPNNCYFTYEADFSDVKRKAFTIMHDKNWVQETVNNALQHIEKNHTNKIRINELLEIIKKEFGICV